MHGKSSHLRQHALTLLELMIVVAVLAIIGALAIPLFAASDQSRLRGAANVLASDLDAARAESIGHAEDPRFVVFDTDNGTWHIAPTSDTTTPINHPETGRPYTRTLGQRDLQQLSGITIADYNLDTDSETNDNKLGFGIYGQTDQTNDATITLAANGMTLTLTVSAGTGEVTIGEIQ